MTSGDDDPMAGGSVHHGAHGPDGSGDTTRDTWHLPDHASWHSEEGYQPQVAAALRDAHMEMGGQPSVEAYHRALARVAPVLASPMSSRQRLHVLFIVALSRAATKFPDSALDPLDEAIELALELAEERAQEDLLLLRGSINRAVLATPDADEDLRDCLELLDLHEIERRPTEEQVRVRLDAVLHLAGTKFLLGEPDMCTRLLSQAEALIPRLTGTEMQQAILGWTQALLLRWRGELEVALATAMAAAETYLTHGHPGNASRAQGLVAEVALDLAERFQQRRHIQATHAFLTLARPYLERALDLARQGSLESSETMARITFTRWERLNGTNTDHEALLRELADLSHANRDVALVAQAYTALGAEYEARGDWANATHWYNRTLAILNESKMTALGIWAQRGLWRLSGEMDSADQ